MFQNAKLSGCNNSAYIVQSSKFIPQVKVLKVIISFVTIPDFFCRTINFSKNLHVHHLIFGL